MKRGSLLAIAAFEAAKLRVAGAVVDHAADTRAAFFAFQAADQLREMRASEGDLRRDGIKG